MLGRKRKTITLDRDKFVSIMTRFMEAEKQRPTIIEIAEATGYKRRQFFEDVQKQKEKHAK